MSKKTFRSFREQSGILALATMCWTASLLRPRYTAALIDGGEPRRYRRRSTETTDITTDLRRDSRRQRVDEQLESQRGSAIHVRLASYWTGKQPDRSSIPG